VYRAAVHAMLSCWGLRRQHRDWAGAVQLSKVRPRPAAPRPFGSRFAARDFDLDSLEFSKKVLHYTWHPKENIIAIAGLNKCVGCALCAL
jgi:hypothetical protein